MRAIQRAGGAHQFGPEFGSVELQRTIANSSYNAFEATLNHRSHGLELLASYTYSKSIDQSTGLPEPVNPVDPSLSRGLSSFDMRHNFVGTFRYEIPNLESTGSALQALAGGWAIAGVARFSSGLPVTLLNNNDTSLLGTIPNGINTPARDTLRDVQAVFNGDAGLQWADLADRLSNRYPHWAGVTADAISAQVRDLGVLSVDIKSGGMVRKGCRVADVQARVTS